VAVVTWGLFRLSRISGSLSRISCHGSPAWKLRSKLAHAEAFLHGLDTVLPANEHNDLYEKLEAILRLTVLRSLLDERFGDRFRDRDAVDAHWPLKP
jgi:hypothetical protein